MAKNPYEWMYERQSQPLKEFVLDEIGKNLALVVEKFPPEIDEWEREDLKARFTPLLSTQTERPRLGVVRVALQLYRWELEREIEAIDQYMRDELWHAEQLTHTEFEVAVFIWHYWVEQTLAFKEYAGNKFKRAELIGIADRLQTQLVEQVSPLRSST